MKTKPTNPINGHTSLILLALAAALLGASLPTRADSIFVSNENSGYVTKYTAGGVGSYTPVQGVSSPMGLAFDSAGNLYVADEVSISIKKITPSGVNSVFAK